MSLAKLRLVGAFLVGLATIVGVVLQIVSASDDPPPPPNPPTSGVSTSLSPPVTKPGPRWDSESEQCENELPVVLHREWQVSAPRDDVSPGEVVELGLRNKFGEAGEYHAVTATVGAPDGTSTSNDTVLHSDEWAEVLYPNEFRGAPRLYPTGTYTVIWESFGTGGKGVIAW